MFFDQPRDTDFRERVYTIYTRGLYEGLHLREIGLEPAEFAQYAKSMGALAVYETRYGIVGILGDLDKYGERPWVYPASR